MKPFYAIAMLMFVLGCTVVPQQITLSPNINVSSSMEGRDVRILLKVVDNRPVKNLGRVFSGSGSSADITSPQDPSAEVERLLVEGFSKKGFKPVGIDDGVTPRVTVEIQLLECIAFNDLPVGKALIKGELKSYVLKGLSTYERNYRMEREEQVAGFPTAEKNERWINSVISEVTSQLISDTSLTRFLTE